MIRRYFLSLLSAVASSCAVSGAVLSSFQKFDEGIPFNSVYSLDHLGKGAVSVALTEDSSGRMVAIDNGILMVFDGNSWSSRLSAKNPGSDSITVAKMGNNGAYYAGSVGMWGTLRMLTNGDFEFFSDKVSGPDWTSAAHFDGISTTSKGVFYYSTLGVVYQEYDTKKCLFWNEHLPVQLVFEYAGDTFLSAGSGGLYRLEEQKWVLLQGTEHLVSSDAIVRMVMRDDGMALLAANSGKVYVFDGKSLHEWKVRASSVLSSGIVDMVALQSSEVAFAVRGYGVVVLNMEGDEVMRLGADHDEAFSGISGLFQQENGILWASLPSGIAKIYYPSQLTFFDYRFGVPMRWPEVYHVKDKLIVFSDYRIFMGEYNSDNVITRFKELPIPGVDLVESCLGYGDQVIFGSGGNIYIYDLKRAPRLIVSGISSARIRKVKGLKDYVIVFGSDQHVLLHRVGDKWAVVQTIPSMGFPAVVFQTQAGEMWVEHGLGRSCRIWIKDGHLEHQDFDKVEGLDNAWLNVWEYRGQVYLSSGGQIRRFDEKSDQIVDASEMISLIEMLGGNISRIFVADDGTLWVSSQTGVALVKTVDGKMVVDRETLRPISEPHPLIRFDSDGIVWILSKGRIIRFNSDLSAPSFNRLFPKLYLAMTTVSSTGMIDMLAVGSDEDAPVTLPFQKNNISLRMFPNTYSMPSPPYYRYRLSGVNSIWSSPVNEPVINFTNLHEGDYKLDVELLDQNVSVGAISSFYFNIQPPWMRTWWAYFSYISLGLATILFVVRISQRHSERERKRLERLVTSRTRELDETNTRLRESIKSAMAAAEAKSRFLANMSHEIRTPMNGVVGTTELLVRTPLSTDQKELVNIINKSGSLLLSIVNDVLDYSKIEADQLIFELIPLRPQTLMDDVLEILGERANEKHVEFFGSIASGIPNEFIGDTTRIQQVLVNLASNALKFTDRGEVEIKGWANERKDGRWDLHFSVRDTGIGMEPKRMNRLFKAFSQLDASNTRVYGGTGLGLAISKRLVEHMGGVLDVSSKVGEGSCFEFSVPLPVSDRARIEETHLVSSRSVLVVDDCAARLAVVSQFLSHSGFDVTSAGSDEAIAILSTDCRFDVAVADCSVENAAWVEVADAINEHASGMPLVVYRVPLQAVDHPAVVRRLSKPWRCNRLVSELRGCLNVDVGKMADVSAAIISDSISTDLSSAELKVLLAEDNIVNQRVGVLLLAKLGIKPDLALNGQEAVDMVSSRSYDIVLMDLQMPIMDGIQATQVIRNTLRLDEQPIVVALTAGAMSSDREAAFSAGVDAYLTKPLRLDTLRDQFKDLIEKVMMRRSARKESS